MSLRLVINVQVTIVRSGSMVVKSGPNKEEKSEMSFVDVL